MARASSPTQAPPSDSTSEAPGLPRGTSAMALATAAAVSACAGSLLRRTLARSMACKMGSLRMAPQMTAQKCAAER
jgi:hypothetical protein